MVRSSILKVFSLQKRTSRLRFATKYINYMLSHAINQVKKNYGMAKYVKIVKIPHIGKGGFGLFGWWNLLSA